MRRRATLLLGVHHQHQADKRRSRRACPALAAQRLPLRGGDRRRL